MKKKIISRGIFTFLLALVLIIGTGVSNVFAATVGQTLATPEAGWQRIDDNSPNITYLAYSYNNALPNYYNSTLHFGTNAFSANFSFYGTKLRVISLIESTCSNSVTITIDGVAENFSTQYGAQGYITLAYEKTGLAYGKHNVTIKNNTTNNYYLDAIDIDSDGSINNIIPPTVVATAGNAKVDLSWNSIDGATSYNVKRSTTSGGPYTSIATGVTATTYTDTSVAIGTTYYYVVTTVNASGESAKSNEVSATLHEVIPPPDVVATAGNMKIDLSWNSIDGATSYNVKRSTTLGGPYATIATGIATTAYTDTSVALGTTYYYVVTTINANGESVNSNEVSGTPFEIRPPVNPDGFTGNKAILEITMTNGKIKEYDLSITDINAFLTWYDNRANGTGKAYYAIKKVNNIKPFLGRKEYIIFDKIQDFEIKDYNE